MIIGFSQLRNELAKGNLENWFRSMHSICDWIYIFDQASDDGSLSYYKKQPNVTVIVSDKNRFNTELECKHILLQEIYKRTKGKFDWIFWMDGDTILSKTFDKKYLNNIETDGVALGHLNLWRSDTWYRLDNAYNSLNEEGVICFWKNNKRLEFNVSNGLHKVQYPRSIKTVTKLLDHKLIHRGFCTDPQIIYRYNTYANAGQSGWRLDRLINEKSLTVAQINESIYPEWFTVTDRTNPTEKTPLLKLVKYYEKKY